jgi:hypothetical protein
MLQKILEFAYMCWWFKVNLALIFSPEDVGIRKNSFMDMSLTAWQMAIHPASAH